MARAARIERLVDAAVEVRLAAREIEDEHAGRRLRRAERLLRREIGPSVPKRRVASLLGISVTALDRWIDAGKVPVVRRPGGREEVEATAVLDLHEEVRGLRAEGRSGRGIVAAALERLAERGLPRPNLRPNPSAAEIRTSFLASTPNDRLRETAELSHVATTLAVYGARRARA